MELLLRRQQYSMCVAVAQYHKKLGSLDLDLMKHTAPAIFQELELDEASRRVQAVKIDNARRWKYAFEALLDRRPELRYGVSSRTLQGQYHAARVALRTCVSAYSLQYADVTEDMIAIVSHSKLSWICCRQIPTRNNSQLIWPSQFRCISWV